MELDEASASLHAEPGDDELALRHARSELRRAAQFAVAGELVASITHDLRQPLTAVEMNISAAIHFLRRRAPALEDAIEALDDALRQQHRMRDALQVLQDLAMRREPRWEGFDVVALLHEVVALVETDALARQVPIEIDAGVGVPPAAGDAMLIRQAFLNVLLDALDATSMSNMPNGPVRIAIRRDGDAAEVSVFHFAARPESSGASEWGLALTRSIAAAHGASIDVRGTTSAGITVVTRWPTHRPATPPSTAALDA